MLILSIAKKFDFYNICHILSCEHWSWYPTIMYNMAKQTWLLMTTAHIHPKLYHVHIHHHSNCTHLDSITHSQYIRILSSLADCEVYTQGPMPVITKPFVSCLNVTLVLILFLVFCFLPIVLHNSCCLMITCFFMTILPNPLLGKKCLSTF